MAATVRKRPLLRLEHVPRTASVSAIGRVELPALEEEPFMVALTGYGPASHAAESLVSRRLKQLEAF